MSLFKRNGVWYTRIKHGKEWRKESTGCTDRKAAEAVHVQRQRVAADPTAYASTFGDLVLAFLGAESVQARSVGTQSMYTQKSRHLVRLLGEATPAHEVDALAVDAYCTQRLEEGAHRNTIAKELITLRGVLRLALRAGTYTRPLDAVLPKWENGYAPRQTFLGREELQRLCAKIPKHRADYVLFCVATGARHSEAMAAQPIDVGADSVYLRSTKTRRKGYGDRTVPITDLTRELLDGITLPLRTWEAGSRTRDLAAACKRAGVPRVTSNDLRRTHATWLVQAGVSDGVAGRVMGHGSAEMVRRVYGQMSAQALVDVVRSQISGTLVGHDNAEQLLQRAPTATAQKQKPPAFAEGIAYFRAGAEGLEPTTCGFGIRTNASYLPQNTMESRGGGTYMGHDAAGAFAAFDAADAWLHSLAPELWN